MTTRVARSLGGRSAVGTTPAHPSTTPMPCIALPENRSVRSIPPRTFRTEPTSGQDRVRQPDIPSNTGGTILNPLVLMAPTMIPAASQLNPTVFVNQSNPDHT